jgi:hypothetical protein
VNGRAWGRGPHAPEEAGGGAPAGAAKPPATWARVFVYGFLVLFVSCAAAGREWWPLSGWKLFSSVRSETAVSWQIVTVDDDEAEHPIPWSALPRSYRGWLHIAPELAADARARAGACQAWQSAVERHSGIEVREIRGYRTTRHGAELERDLRFTC